STGMTRKGALEFLFQYCTLAMHLNRYELSAFFWVRSVKKVLQQP
ncbi:hypothetical protein N499_0052B, partial [Wolbachia pipientis wVitA]